MIRFDAIQYKSCNTSLFVQIHIAIAVSQCSPELKDQELQQLTSLFTLIMHKNVLKKLIGAIILRIVTALLYNRAKFLLVVYLKTLMVLADGGSPDVSTSTSEKYSS